MKGATVKKAAGTAVKAASKNLKQSVLFGGKAAVVTVKGKGKGKGKGKASDSDGEDAPAASPSSPAAPAPPSEYVFFSFFFLSRSIFFSSFFSIFLVSSYE